MTRYTARPAVSQILLIQFLTHTPALSARTQCSESRCTIATEIELAAPQFPITRTPAGVCWGHDLDLLGPPAVDDEVRETSKRDSAGDSRDFCAAHHMPIAGYCEIRVTVACNSSQSSRPSPRRSFSYQTIAARISSSASAFGRTAFTAEKCPPQSGGERRSNPT